MARIRLNQEYRNKGGVRFREHLEQEETQEKRKVFPIKRKLQSNPKSNVETCRRNSKPTLHT